MITFREYCRQLNERRLDERVDTFDDIIDWGKKLAFAGGQGFSMNPNTKMGVGYVKQMGKGVLMADKNCPNGVNVYGPNGTHTMIKVTTYVSPLFVDYEDVKRKTDQDWNLNHGEYSETDGTGGSWKIPEQLSALYRQARTDEEREEMLDRIRHVPLREKYGKLVLVIYRNDPTNPNFEQQFGHPTSKYYAVDNANGDMVELTIDEAEEWFIPSKRRAARKPITDVAPLTLGTENVAYVKVTTGRGQYDEKLIFDGVSNLSCLAMLSRADQEKLLENINNNINVD